MLREFLSKIKLSYVRIKFRNKNKHNRTFAASNFPIKCVSIGRNTYGPLHITWMAPLTARLEIGNYCSIGPGVKFLIGGRHNYKRISTYPFQTVVYHEATKETCKKMDIIIEDDVWIGFESLIMTGVRIGKGSIIGARSIVTKDVPPYSVFIGNRVVKPRFPDCVVSKLKEIDYSKLNHKKDDNYQQYCQTEIDENNIDSVLHAFIN